MNFDDTQALQEGWLIADVDDAPIGMRWQLQKADQSDIFLNDFGAWQFVCHRAQAGSEYHKNALEFIKNRSPKEYSMIASECK